MRMKLFQKKNVQVALMIRRSNGTCGQIPFYEKGQIFHEIGQ